MKFQFQLTEEKNFSTRRPYYLYIMEAHLSKDQNCYVPDADACVEHLPRQLNA